jgi:hypothetical protein
MHSQTAKPTYMGLKIGYNNSNMSGKDSNGEASGLLGNEFYLSLFKDTQLKEQLSLQTELLFSFTSDYHFIEIPITMKFKIYKKLDVFLGPKLDFLLDNDNDRNEAPYYLFRNFGVSADFGIQYPLSDHFFAEMRYSIGFTEQLTRDVQLDINNATRNTFRIGVGYKF